MKIVSIVLGVLMLLGFRIKHKDDGKDTEKGLFLFATIYILCGTALVLIPIII